MNAFTRIVGFLCASVPLAMLARSQTPTVNLARSEVLNPPEKIAFQSSKAIADLPSSTEYEVTFPSPIVSGYPKNDTVPLRIFMPLDAIQPVPMVLITHYWGATDLKAEYALAADLNNRGLAAAVITLPYHLDRTPDGFKSGELAVQPDPAKLSQMMLQSEQDIRRSFDFFDTRPEFDRRGYGIVGISLGALVSSLAFAVDARVKFATFALGGVDFAHILWTSSRVTQQKLELRRKGFDEEKLRTELAAVEPLNYLPRNGAPKTFVIEGKYDTVIPRLATAELIEKLDHPEVLKLNTGHYGGIFVQGKILQTVTTFFATTMNNQPFEAPRKFSGVTLRIGGLLSYPQGADLGIGVDLFHLDPAGANYGSILVTPRGPRFFLGHNLANGLSIGFVASGKGIGAGLLLNVIL